MAVDRTERLLNLVFCLMGAARPVSRAEIAASVPGYGEAPSTAALERMFERDKDELRGMGIPVETVVDVNGDVLGYRVPHDAYALEALSFDARESAVLALAASVWDEATIGSDALTALRKVEAAAGLQPSDPPERVLVRHGAEGSGVRTLLGALREGRRVAFAYRAADGSRSERQVDPWGVIAREGRWYLVGHDAGRDGVRAFRVDRIEGAVSVSRALVAVRRPDDVDVASLIGGADAAGRGVRAEVRADRGRGAQLRRHAIGDVDPIDACVFQVEAPTIDALVQLACAAAPGAVVTGPPEMVTAVRARLAASLAAHEAGT